jgi:hypothetical protein
MFTTQYLEIFKEDTKNRPLFYSTTKDNYTPSYINPNTLEKSTPSLYCATIK